MGGQAGDLSEAEVAPDNSGDEHADDFFNAEDMEHFTALGDEGKLRLESDAEDSDFGALEDVNEGTSKAERARNATYADFFLPGGDATATTPKGKRRRASMGTKMGTDAQQGAASGDDDSNEGDELLEQDRCDEAEDVADIDESKHQGRSLYEMDKRLRSLEEEVAKLEEEQLADKPWTLQGEVSAKQRPLNSLLEVHLDQPMTHFAGRRAEDAAVASGAAPEGESALDEVAGADGLGKSEHFDVEAVIRQRVWDELFDNVERKTELPPSQRPHTADAEVVETLNFEKSRVGLGDIYAQQFEAEMLGHATEAKAKEDTEKADVKQIFAKVMHKLDLLTNAHFTPRPPMLGTSGEQLDKVASLKMEETIPLLVSDTLLKAPEELRAPRRHDKERSELVHEERVAARRRKKTMRKKALERRVEKGELTLAGLKEREAKLGAKNLTAKKERALKGQIKERKKKLKASELLQQAAENVASDVSRKGEARSERRKAREVDSSNTHSSKSLKL